MSLALLHSVTMFLFNMAHDGITDVGDGVDAVFATEGDNVTNIEGTDAITKYIVKAVANLGAAVAVGLSFKTDVGNFAIKLCVGAVGTSFDVISNNAVAEAIVAIAVVPTVSFAT